MSRINLDIDVLRTLVSAYQLGGFNRAAAQVGRSQSAVSQQIHKLEERVGRRLFVKRGRGLVLTEAGEIVLAYARRILDLNDEAVAAATGAAIEGTIRFGMPGDFAETWLPAALGRFKRAHPTVRIEATVDRNTSLIDKMNRGKIDLALVLGPDRPAGAEALATLPMAWIGNTREPVRTGDPIPLAVFEQPCFFRAAAIAALDAAGLPWRIEFISPSLSGLWAAIDAGLGITVRTAVSAPAYLADIGVKLGLPNLPSVELSLYGITNSPALVQLHKILHETLPLEISQIRRHNMARLQRAVQKRAPRSVKTKRRKTQA